MTGDHSKRHTFFIFAGFPELLILSMIPTCSTSIPVRAEDFTQRRAKDGCALSIRQEGILWMHRLEGEGGYKTARLQVRSSVESYKSIKLKGIELINLPKCVNLRV